MKVLPFSPEAINEAITVLQQGGIVVHATETCYGIACDLTNPDAVQKLFLIKQRPTDKPVSGLFPSVEEAKKYVAWNDQAQKLADQYLPGPLTLILPIRIDAPFIIYPTMNLVPKNEKPKTQNRSLGIRVSPHPHALDLATSFGKPLSTTSANVHGKDNPYSADDVVAQFSDQEFQPDLILDSGPLPLNPPSTVMDLTGDAPEQKRQGTVLS